MSGWGEVIFQLSAPTLLRTMSSSFFLISSFEMSSCLTEIIVVVGGPAAVNASCVALRRLDQKSVAPSAARITAAAINRPSFIVLVSMWIAFVGSPGYLLRHQTDTPI